MTTLESPIYEIGSDTVENDVYPRIDWVLNAGIKLAFVGPTIAVAIGDYSVDALRGLSAKASEGLGMVHNGSDYQLIKTGVGGLNNGIGIFDKYIVNTVESSFESIGTVLCNSKIRVFDFVVDNDQYQLRSKTDPVLEMVVDGYDRIASVPIVIIQSTTDCLERIKSGVTSGN
jgi:hypothetical protein